VNKAQAFDSWRRDALPELRLTYERDGTLDRPARRESWNNFVDALIKAGALAESAGNWSHPRGVETCQTLPGAG
jgi:hypothetical protein